MILDPGGRYQADWDEPPGVGVPVREINQGGEEQGGRPGKPIAAVLGWRFSRRLGKKDAVVDLWGLSHHGMACVGWTAAPKPTSSPRLPVTAAVPR